MRRPRTAGALQRSPERLLFAAHLGAAFSRLVSKRADFFGRMRLIIGLEVSVVLTRHILAPNKLAYIL